MDKYWSSPSQSESTSSPATSPSVTPIWDEAKSILSRELSEQSFKTWLAPVTCVKHDTTTIFLSVPDAYFGNWLKTHYEALISSAVEEVTGSRLEIDYVVAKQPAPSTTPKIPPSTSSGSPRAIPDSQSLNKLYTFDDFVVGPGNRFAHAAALAVCEAPARQYNPLFIYGPVGLGKTHLMQSIAHEIKRLKRDFHFLYLASEKFTNQLITAIQTRSTTQFRNKFRNADLLLIDDNTIIRERLFPNWFPSIKS